MGTHENRGLRVAAAICALVVALFLGACGGGDEETQTKAGTASVPVEVGSSTEASEQGKDLKQEDTGRGGSGDSQKEQGASHINAAPLKVSGGGSAQFRVKGGDNSVQDYGGEAEESELREVATRVHSFYVARVAGEWARACSYLAKSTIEGFEKLAAGAPQLKDKGCAGVLDALTESPSPSLQRQLTTVDAAALRSEGEQAFLLYTGPPGKTVYSMPLRLEDGEWKLGALNGSALPGAKAP